MFYLNSGSAYDYLLSMCNLQVRDYCYMTLLPTLDCGEGRSNGFDPGKIIVGIHGIGHDAVTPVSTVKFMYALAAIAHETRHADQFYKLRHGSDRFSRIIAVSDKAFRCNPDYADLNYWDSPCEVDAERYAVHQVFAFCVDQFGADQAERMVCKYVNSRVRRGKCISWIGRAEKRSQRQLYHSIDTIFSDFDDAFDASVHKHRRYDLNYELSGDELARYFRIVPRHYEIFCNESDGEKQDMMAAAVVMYQEHEDESKGIPGLRDISLVGMFYQNDDADNYKEEDFVDVPVDREHGIEGVESEDKMSTLQ